MTTEIQQLSDVTLKEWFASKKLPDDIMIIDIREPSEYAREHIPNSQNIPAAELAKTDFSHDRHKSAIFHCRLGSRTKAAEADILRTGFKQIYCLPGGIEQWKKCGLPVAIDRQAPIDIMRQVQIAVGLLVLLGVLLSYLVSPHFILLSAFVGAGMLFAGITGTCGMAKLLSCMPWNRYSCSTHCK